MAFGKHALIALALLALPSPAAARTPGIEHIEMETSSWGDPVTSWRIASDGTGEYRYRRDLPDRGTREADFVTKRFQAGRAGFARIARILRPVFARQQIMCREKQIYDLPYGHIGWQAGGRTHALGFDLGCTDRPSQRALGQLGDAERLIEAWAHDAPEAEVRRISVR